MNDGGKRHGVRVENFQIKQEVASEPCQIKTRSFQTLRNRRCRLFLFWLSTFPLNIIAPILLRSARQNENQNPRRVVFPFFSFFFWATPEKDFFGGEEVLTRSVSSCQRLLSKQRLCEVRARTRPHAHAHTLTWEHRVSLCFRRVTSRNIIQRALAFLPLGRKELKSAVH